MSTFIQFHLLTSYPPSNLNRDDLGRPKTAVMGGKNRLRVSSQSLKRAWRTSDIFANAVEAIGVRTKSMGREVYDRLIAGGITEKEAIDYAQKIAGQFGKSKKAKEEKKDNEKKDGAKKKADPLVVLDIEQLMHFSPEEQQAINDLVERIISTKAAPEDDELKLLRKENSAADIALFGRMLANTPDYNVEAAAQVAHAITVHEVAVEDDFFTAVDDLNKGDEDSGAGHLGETEFVAGLFYLYVCIDRDQLVRNLGGEKAVPAVLEGLAEACAKIAPTGKQNSFASRAYCQYFLAEKGEQQPRSLSVAFLKSVRGNDHLEAAIEALEDTRDKMDTAYAKCYEQAKVLNVQKGEGTFAELVQFISE